MLAVLWIVGFLTGAGIAFAYHWDVGALTLGIAAYGGIVIGMAGTDG